MTDEPKPVLIEQTRKRYKIAIAIGVILMLVSPVSCVARNFSAAAMRDGIGLFLIGLIVYLAAKALAWWKHG